MTLENIRLRNPKLDDYSFGDVINDSDILENCHLFDEKEIYVQIMDPERTFTFTDGKSDNSLHILIRSWDPSSWELGPLYEIKVDRSA